MPNPKPKPARKRYVADFECRELISSKTFMTVTGIEAKNYPDAFKRAFREWRKKPGVAGKRFNSVKVTISEIKARKNVPESTSSES